MHLHISETNAYYDTFIVFKTVFSSIHPIPFQVILFYANLPYSIPLHSFLNFNVDVTYSIDFMTHLKGCDLESLKKKSSLDHWFSSGFGLGDI